MHQATLSIKATRADVVALAREMVARDVRFVRFGRTPETGLDCCGMVQYIGQTLGLLPLDMVLPDYSYRSLAQPAFDALSFWMDEVDTPDDGDVVVLLGGGRRPRPKHLMIAASDGAVRKLIGTPFNYETVREIDAAGAQIHSAFSFRYE